MNAAAAGALPRTERPSQCTPLPPRCTSAQLRQFRPLAWREAAALFDPTAAAEADAAQDEDGGGSSVEQKESGTPLPSNSGLAAAAAVAIAPVPSAASRLLAATAAATPSAAPTPASAAQTRVAPLPPPAASSRSRRIFPSRPPPPCDDDDGGAWDGAAPVAAAPSAPPAAAAATPALSSSRVHPSRSSSIASLAALGTAETVHSPPAPAPPLPRPPSTAKRKQPSASADADRPSPDAAAGSSAPATPTSGPASKRPKRAAATTFHLRGTIRSISPVIQRDTAAAFFFVDLCETTSIEGDGADAVTADASPSAAGAALLSTIILFAGASALRWRPLLHVNGEYLLTRLRVSTVFQDKPGYAQRVFVTTVPPPTTKVPAANNTAGTSGDRPLQPRSHVDNEAKQTLVLLIRRPASPPDETGGILPAAPSSAPNLPGHLDCSGPAQPPLHSSSSSTGATSVIAAPVAAAPGRSPSALPTCLTYTGTVTAHLSWGLYELDADPSLLLFLSPLTFAPPAAAAPSMQAAAAAGVGVGTQTLDVAGLHVGARVRLHHVHPLVQAGRCLGLMCCLYTHIEILSPSPPPAVVVAVTPTAPLLPPSWDRARYDWYAQLWLRYPAREVALLLRLFYRDWRDKMGHVVSSQRMLSTPLPSAGDWGALRAPFLLRLLAPLMGRPGAPLPLSDAEMKVASMDMYQQFFAHHRCNVAGSSSSLPRETLRQRMPFLIPLAELGRVRPVRQARQALAPSTVSAVSPSSSSSSSSASVGAIPLAGLQDWNYRCVHSSELRAFFPHLHVVGVLQACAAFGVSESPFHRARPSGSPSLPPSSPLLRTAMRLVDQSDSIDCVVVGDLQPHHLNAVLHLPVFVLILEASPVIVAAPAPATAVPSSTSAHTGPKADSATETTAATSDPRVLMTLLFNIQDVVIIQHAPAPSSSSSSSAAAATAPLVSAGLAPKTFVLLHKSDSIVMPSATGWKGSSGVGAGVGFSAQPKLSSASFHPTLHTVLDVMVLDGGRRHEQTGSAPAVRLATLQLEGSAAQMYPFLPLHRALHFDAVQSLRSDTNAQRFCIPALTRATVQPLPLPLPLASPPLIARVLDVRDVLVCPVPLVPVPAGPGGGLDIDRVSFRGLLLEKQFCAPMSQQHQHQQQQQLKGSRGVSCASGPGTRRWWLNVRDVTFPHTVSVYLDPGSSLLPAGLIPGSLVLFQRVRRRLSTKYALHVDCDTSSALVLERCAHLDEADLLGSAVDPRSECAFKALRVALHTHFPLRPLPLTHLASLSPFAPSLSSLTLQLRVRIHFINKLMMQWRCSGCGSAVQPGARKCVPRASVVPGGGVVRACDPSLAPLHLYLEAIARVDDGSAMATLYVDGNGVWDLLQLSSRQRAQLDDFSLRMGSFTYARISREGDKWTADDSGDGSDVAALQQVQAQLWQRHLREAYPGMQLMLCATQFFMHKTIRQAAEKRAKAEAEAAAAASAAAAAAAAQAGGASSAPAAAAVPGPCAPAVPSASSSSIPFDMCTPWKFKLGPLHLDTLQSPPICLRAVAIQPVQVRQQANLILQQLLNG